jgi:hypothetical protein
LIGAKRKSRYSKNLPFVSIFRFFTVAPWLGGFIIPPYKTMRRRERNGWAFRVRHKVSGFASLCWTKLDSRFKNLPFALTFWIFASPVTAVNDRWMRLNELGVFMLY